RAELRPWLLAVEVEELCNPKAVTETRKFNAKGNWWGVYDHAISQMTLGRLFDSPFDDEPKMLYRSTTTTHEYLWDQQAIDGKATEIVLEKYDIQAPRSFREVMAILI